MGKLKLNLDEIKVESFVTNESQKMIGTVHGHDQWQSGQVEGCYTDESGCCGGGGGGTTPSVNVICTGNQIAQTCAFYSCNAESCGGTCAQTCNANGNNYTCAFDCTHDSCFALCTDYGATVCDFASDQGMPGCHVSIAINYCRH